MKNDCLENVYSVDLEQWYGTTLIAHTLGYLTLGHNGLSETELEDVLSCNDKVRQVVEILSTVKVLLYDHPIEWSPSLYVHKNGARF